MKKRIFGNTNKMVSEIGLGTWQLGTKWAMNLIQKKQSKF